MKMLSLLALVLTLGLTFATGDAEAARRLGGGKSMGMQKATPPAAAPSSPSAAKAPAAAPAAAPAPGRSWMGPLAGLAAGLGLAALASHFGFGEGLANMMMIGLLIVVVMAVIGFIMRKRAAGQQPGLAGAGAGASPFQFNGSSAPEAAPASRPFDVAMPPSSPMSATAASTAPAGNIPADFDVTGFTRHAKVNFIRMQAANDAGNLDDIREFTTPEMFAELKMDLAERGAAKQETDVVSIDASVLDVAEETGRYVVSVRFTGVIRENNGPAESVDEIWHLAKPRDGKTGWLLSGIQQPQ